MKQFDLTGRSLRRPECLRTRGWRRIEEAVLLGRGSLVLLVLVILITGLPAVAGAKAIRGDGGRGPGASHDRSFGHWTATFSGTLDYEWSEPATEPTCSPQGDGSVRATFSGQLGSFEIGTVDLGGGLTNFGLTNNTTQVNGHATLTDNRKIIPPPWGCGSYTIDKSGCGTRGISPSTFYLDTTYYTQQPQHMTMSVAVLNAFANAACYRAGMLDFDDFPGQPPYAYLMGPQLTAAMFERRQAFAVTATDIHQHTPGTHTTRRSVTIKFTPEGSQLKGDELGAPHATLLDTTVWRATLYPPWATAKSYTWEMKPSSESRWTDLGTTAHPTYKITYRLAGNFKLRVWFNGASAGGVPRRLVSPVRPVEVRFPSWDDIVANKDVAHFTRNAWARTLDLATGPPPASTPNWRQEVGFWISLRTCSGTYGHTTMREGPRTGPNDRAKINIGPRPADTTNRPDPVKGCYTYMVASFHTHTPTTFLSRGRGVGPSKEDQDFNNRWKVPGVVYDYIASPPGSKNIPPRHPKNSKAKPYHAGLFRRPTLQT